MTVPDLANREHLYPGWEHTARMITEFRRLSDDVFVTWTIALEVCVPAPAPSPYHLTEMPAAELVPH
jgi:hypothetical protein